MSLEDVLNDDEANVADWQYFEHNVLAYLIDNFWEYAQFELCGGHDSTVSDILVFPKQGEPFYIDVKLLPAHAGQFTVNNSQYGFAYSRNNTVPWEDNPASWQIVDILNDHYNEYFDISTSGQRIIGCEEIARDWITTKYLNKGVRLFAIGTHKDDTPKLIPVDMLDGLNCYPVLRAKRSGTRSCAMRYVTPVIEYTSDQYELDEETDFCVDSDGRKKHLYVTSGTIPPLTILDVPINDDGCIKEFMIANDGEEIRTRGTTKTLTVLMKLEEDTPGSVISITPDDFINYYLT